MRDWNRVSRNEPCICGHDTWCLVAKDGSAYLCMRLESPIPVKLKDESIGWIHRTGTRKVELRRKEPEPEPQIDATAMMRTFWAATTDQMRGEFAVRIGVSPLALHDIGCCWAAPYHAWAFPMFTGQRQCVGIRLRNEAGRKWAVTGSRQGIFWPKRPGDKTVWIVEGPTDCAAALTLDLFALGRPCCSGCVAAIQVAINQIKASRAVLVADNDGPGIKGAAFLANELQIPCAHVLLPVKDLRQFVQFGGDREFLESQLKSLVWKQPK